MAAAEGGEREIATRRGLELDSVTGLPCNDLGNPPSPSGAESGAVGAESDPIAPELAAIIAAWPALPEATRQAILAMVKATAGG